MSCIALYRALITVVYRLPGDCLNEKQSQTFYQDKNLERDERALALYFYEESISCLPATDLFVEHRYFSNFR
jgi:hypothetical protein